MVLLAGCSSLPGGAAKEADEHVAHHPPQAGTTAVDFSKVDQQMKTMQEMHQKMQSAKTPEERAALMKDHMKTMQDGMAMMGQMRGGMGMGMGGGKGATGGGMSMDSETMKRRMDMMEMMMQMMMDREGPKPLAAK